MVIQSREKVISLMQGLHGDRASYGSGLDAGNKESSNKFD